MCTDSRMNDIHHYACSKENIFLEIIKWMGVIITMKSTRHPLKTPWRRNIAETITIHIVIPGNCLKNFWKISKIYFLGTTY